MWEFSRWVVFGKQYISPYPLPPPPPQCLGPGAGLAKQAPYEKSNRGGQARGCEINRCRHGFGLSERFDCALSSGRAIPLRTCDRVRSYERKGEEASERQGTGKRAGGGSYKIRVFLPVVALCQKNHRILWAQTGLKKGFEGRTAIESELHSRVGFKTPLRKVTVRQTKPSL